MKSIYLLAGALLLVFTATSQKNTTPNYKTINAKEKRTFVLGIDSIMDDRARATFIENWKYSRMVIEASPQTDMTLLADTSNLIVTRAKLYDSGGDLRSALVLLQGGVDTTQVKMRKDGYLEIKPSAQILAQVWVNPSYLDSYTGLLYFQALYTDLRIKSSLEELSQYEKSLIKSMRNNKLKTVYVRASQLEDYINSPSAINDLSNNLAKFWKKDVVQTKLRNKESDVAFVDINCIKIGDSYSKEVYVMGINGLIYAKSFPSADASNKLGKTEFRDLMQIINDKQKKD